MAVLVATLMCALGANAQQAYACYTESNMTLTFYYDNQRSSRSGTTYSVITNNSHPYWYDDNTNASVTKVVFDSSFAGARPTNTIAWFDGMTNLQSITGLSYLNTSNVTSMGAMFQSCRSLTSLDLSSFNTSNVTDMIGMFSQCEALTSLDLSSFDTHNVNAMSLMFQNDFALKTIYVGDGWSTDAVTSSNQMFWNCVKLVGSQGTVYDNAHTDIEYAHIDDYNNPGYLSYPGAPAPPEAYACYTPSNTTLTFYFDNQRASRTGTTYDMKQIYNTPGWKAVNSSVTKVVFDSSFAGARPTTTHSWLSGMNNLQSITGISNLNTSKVTYMDRMFKDCSSLTSLDLSHFDTSQVTDMSSMFNGCSSLASLDVSSFNTSQVTNMIFMFDGCRSLTSLNLSSFNTSQVTDMEMMFRDCRKLTTLNLGSNFNTSKVTSMEDMFRDCSNLTSLDVSGWNTSQVTDMTAMFDGCSSLTSLDVSGWNTSNVTDMWHMFNGCSSLTSLDVSGWDTSQVTDMQWMFNGCSSLTSLDVSGWNPSNVTNMWYMFNGCSSLTSLNVSNWNTSNVINMDGMFIGCSSLTSLDVSHFNTSNVINMGSMFSGCRSLTSLDVSNFNTSQAENMGGMFRNCYSLTNLDVSHFDTSSVTYMYWMFEGCSSLTNLDLSNFNTENVIDMESMFEGCSGLTSLDLSHFDTSNVTDMNQMFDDCSSLTSLDLGTFNTSQVTNMYKMFWDSNNLQTIYVGDGWSTDAVTSSDHMFSGCEHLVGGKGTTWKSSNPTDKTYAHIDGGTSNPGYFTAARTGYASYNPTAKMLAFYFDDKRSYHEGRGETTYDLNQGSAKPGWYTDGTYAEVTRVHFDQSFANARPKSTYYWCADMANLDNITNSTYINTSEVKNMESMFQGCRKMTILDLSHFNTSKVTTMAHMFDGCGGTTVLNMSNFDTSNVTDMSYVFANCYILQSIDLGGSWNTSNVTSMKGMFENCLELTSLDLSSFTTSNVTTMRNMFLGCRRLESLDLSTFNTARVTSMSNMFNDCENLSTIYAGNDWSTTAVTESDNMFFDCKELVGGKGTAYTSNHVDKTYARIDQPTLRPGYFTVKGTMAYACYTPSNTTLTFYYDNQRKSRTGVGVKIFDVKTDDSFPAWITTTVIDYVTKVVFKPEFATVRPTNTSCWFQHMEHVTSIQDLGYLNTSEVRKMNNMFNSCMNLSSIDLSHFDTDLVTSMTGMFEGCSSVTELDLSRFNTAKVTNMGNMFYNCMHLKTIFVAPNKWSTSGVTSSSGMFYGCTNIKGSKGTAYNADYVDKTYARIDGGTSNPGYFTAEGSEAWAYEAYAVYTEEGERTLTFYYDTQKNSRTGSIYNVEYHNWLGNVNNLNRVVFDPSFADYRPTSTSEWFLNMSNLLSIEGIEYLNTSEVTDMSFMFNNCIGQYFLMKTLDLSHFNTAKVTNMQAMFANNSRLTTILVGNGWTTDAVTNSANMFYGCTQLVGDQGTAYNANYLDKTYARLDGGTGSPGYFSHFKEPYACYMAGNKSLTFYYDNQRSSRAGTTYDLNTGNNRPGWTEDYSVASGISTVVFDQSFATALPATTAYWFADMAGLRTITGWENLNTQFVTDMSYMFSNCGMPTLDLTSFDTFLTRDMSYMFYRCRATSIDMSNFNTSSVDTMEGMFSWCFNLTHLDLDSFKTTDVEVMTSMFENCPYLNTICVGTNWTTDGVTESDNMFNGCTRLVGGLGTAYSVANPQDKTYAHLDGGTSNPGYFSRFQAYAVYTPANTTLTFYYDSKRDSRTGTTYDMNKGSNAPGWGAVNSSVTQVVFDSSFADYCPTTTRSWFSGMTNLQTITDMSYLNTSEVTDMSFMFYGCSSLTSLELSNFNTAKVKAMAGMFRECSGLTSLDLSSFNTANVTLMQAMFNGCSGLTSLDLRGFNTSQVLYMNQMFKGCSRLETIYASDDWTTATVTNSSDMFLECINLEGGQGTTYNASHVDKTYAHIDGGPSNPGYFTEAVTGVATHIEAVPAKANTVKGIYTLDGRKLNDLPTQKGIYIIDGHKVVIK